MSETRETREHPHRLDIGEPTTRVKVTHERTVLADTSRAIVLREGSLPPRYYIPADDVRMGLLAPSDTTSHCPFKGDASYWSIDGVPDVAWSYQTPIPEAAPIAGTIAFYNEKVDIEVEP